MIAIEDDKIVVKNGGTAETMFAGEAARPNLPDEFPLKIMGGGDDLGLVLKGRKDSLAVSGGCAGGVGIQSVLAFECRLQHDALPQ